MRIYNAKNSLIELPLSGGARITVGSHSISKDFMPSDYFLGLVASTFEKDEIALIVSGPYEINMCAKNPAVSDKVVQTLDEAIARFSPKKEIKVEEEVVVPEEEPVVEEEVVFVPEAEEEVEIEFVPEPEVKEEPKPTKGTRKNKKNKKG